MKKKALVVSGDIERYSPEIEYGLNSSQVDDRVLHNLTNKVTKKYSKSYFSIFASNLFTFFNLLGLIVTVALICIGAKPSRFFFILIYFANISIGIIQEIRAKLCIDRLSLMSNKNTKVIRNGEVIDIASNEIVLDDIIKLGLNSQVPTDCIILEGEIEVNESLLTGESVAVKKKVGDELFAGSFITSGVCTVKAHKVGKDNYIEKLSEKAKEYKKPHSELMISLKIIITIIGIIIAPIAGFSLLKNALYDVDIISSIDTTATIVIGMIPSGMFLLTSMALAVGVIKLARHKTLVQDLYSLEMLARVDTICFDKTGTITDGKMTVKDVIELNGDKISTHTIVSSMLNSLKDNNQTSIALFNYFGESNELVPLSVIPFSSSRKLSAVTFEKFGTYSMGAPEFVLSEKEYNKIKDKVNEYASCGYRVLVVAHSKNIIDDDKVPNDFSPISLIILADNIREDAISTIKWFKENDVNIKVISGDNPITVSEVSKRVGIENADKYISLEGLSDEEVISIANEYTVFGRVSPEQKALLIKSMKSAGHVTAMTGDGVNDILALKESDCAVTVASGSEATRNISHIVLMDNNFNSMPKVVYEGRRVINNIQSSASLYLMKTLFTMFLALIVLVVPAFNSYPFNLSQMIILEIFIIGMPSFFLSLQANDSRVEGDFISYVIKKSLPSATIMVFSVIVIQVIKFIVGNNDIGTEQVYSTMSIFAVTFSGLISLFFICKPLNLYRRVLFYTTLFVILLMTCAGFSVIDLAKMMPISDYWPYLLILVSVIIIDIPLTYLLLMLFNKLKFSFNIMKKIKK